MMKWLLRYPESGIYNNFQDTFVKNNIPFKSGNQIVNSAGSYPEAN